MGVLRARGRAWRPRRRALRRRDQRPREEGAHCGRGRTSDRRFRGSASSEGGGAGEGRAGGAVPGRVRAQVRAPPRPARRSASDCSGLAARPGVDGRVRRSASPAAPASRNLSRRSSRARGGSRVPPGSAAAWPDGASAEGRAQGSRGQRGGRAPAPEQVPDSAGRGELRRRAWRGRAAGVVRSEGVAYRGRGLQSRAAPPGLGVRTPDGNSGRESFPDPDPVCRGLHGRPPDAGVFRGPVVSSLCAVLRAVYRRAVGWMAR